MEQKHFNQYRLNTGDAINTLIQRQQKQVILLYLVITLLLFTDRWLNGMLMSQLHPSFFVTRMDVSTWAFMYTGIHTLFVNNYTACVVADVLLIVLPIIYVVLFYKMRYRLAVITAWVILLFNWLYVQCYVLYPSNSIEGHVGWLLFPVVLICIQPVDFSLALKFIRYVLLFFFASAGLWKIRNGGIFTMEEMSGVLLFQHKEFLVTSPNTVLTPFYYWLIAHPVISYCLYAAGTLLELTFLAGFFTRRMDKMLLILFFIFLISDILVMRIKYWEILYLVIPLFFSKKELFMITDSTVNK